MTATRRSTWPSGSSNGERRRAPGRSPHPAAPESLYHWGTCSVPSLTGGGAAHCQVSIYVEREILNHRRLIHPHIVEMREVCPPLRCVQLPAPHAAWLRPRPAGRAASPRRRALETERKADRRSCPGSRSGNGWTGRFAKHSRGGLPALWALVRVPGWEYRRGGRVTSLNPKAQRH